MDIHHIFIRSHSINRSSFSDFFAVARILLRVLSILILLLLPPRRRRMTSLGSSLWVDLCATLNGNSMTLMLVSAKRQHFCTSLLTFANCYRVLYFSILSMNCKSYRLKWCIIFFLRYCARISEPMALKDPKLFQWNNFPIR